MAKAIIAEDVVPGYADKYLAEHGYDSPQTDRAISPARRDNLFEPVPGDHGAHGNFDLRARSFSPLFWFSKHRIGLACAGLALGALALGLRSVRRSH